MDQKYFSIIEPWLEPEYKMIAQPPAPISDGDQGDTAQREGMFAFAAYVLHSLGKMSDEEYQFCISRYLYNVSLLNDPNHGGFLRRFPDTSYWGGLSDRFSRDQATSNVVAMGFCSPDDLKKFFLRHLKFSALLFMDNTRNNGAYPPGDSRYIASDYKWKLPDITFGSFWGMYIRGFNIKILYPLLLLCDLDLLVSALIKVLYYDRDLGNNDDLSHLMVQYQASLVMSTPWSMLAKWIYKKFRKYPNNSGAATNPAQASMNAYFRGTNPGPKLEEIYQEINTYFMG